MNRRDLIRQGPLALLGIGVAAVGVKATPHSERPVVGRRGPELQELRIFVHAEPGTAFEDAVVAVVLKDVETSGPIRQLLERNTAIGL